jgi:hypothetical protein
MPPPRWADPTAIEMLLALVTVVEHFEGTLLAWRTWQVWLSSELCLSKHERGRGRPPTTAFWIAVAEVARWVHRDAGLARVSWRQVIQILRALGWPTLYTPKTLKLGLRDWRRTFPPPAVIPLPQGGRAGPLCHPRVLGVRHVALAPPAYPSREFSSPSGR